jgi:uncharacterized coiled-coil DUF342 family protein
MSDITDVELDYYRERIAELEAERDQLCADAKRYKDDRDQILANLLDPPNLIGVLLSERDAIQRDYESLVTVLGSMDKEVGRLRDLLKQLVGAVDEMDDWCSDDPRIYQLGFAMYDARRYLMEPLK